MANQSQLATLHTGSSKWNAWRKANPATRIDLSNATLVKANLRGAKLNLGKLNSCDLREAVISGSDLTSASLPKANLRESTMFKAVLKSATFKEADLTKADMRECVANGAFFHTANLARARMQGGSFAGADFSQANLKRADLSNADLSGADFFSADLRQAVLQGANLQKANLRLANLAGADLSGANLQYANLEGAQLIQTNLENADISGSRVYGVSAWGLRLKGTLQSNLTITNRTKLVHPFRPEPTITTDNLEVAQFIYLLLNNEKVRSVLDAISTKVVLILGRFTPERKVILDALRDALRKRDLLPILFDFDKPLQRDITETVSTLAHIARFVIADITDAKSIPQELQRIVPDLPSVPVQPLLQVSEGEYGMFEHFKRYPWVLSVHRYQNAGDLIANLADKVIEPAEAKAKELQTK